VSHPLRGHRQSGRTGRRWPHRWGLALAVFAVLDVLLVTWALTVGTPSGQAREAPLSVATTSVIPTPTAAPAAPAAAVRPHRLLSSLNTTTAWRASTGECPASRAAPELSTDAGASWTGFDAGNRTGASSVLVVNALNPVEASLVVLSSADCFPHLIATYVAGIDWADYPLRLTGNWYVNPAEPAIVHSPRGAFAAPCPEVIAVAAQSESVGAVLCPGGRTTTTATAVTSTTPTGPAIIRTLDGGASWKPAVAVPGAVNLAGLSGGGYVIAAAGQAGCAGVQVLTLAEPAAVAATAVGCREAAFGPGEVAIASSPGVLWLWAGAIMCTSIDGGATWP